jgi:hypothetical protein
MATQNLIEARGLSKSEVQTAIETMLKIKNLSKKEKDLELMRQISYAVGVYIVESRDFAVNLYNRILEAYPDIVKET